MGNSPSTGALVLGANYRALGVARSLGRHGIAVRLVKTDRHTVARYSRYAGALLPWPHPSDDGRATSALLELCDRHGLDGWTLIPTDDESAALVSRRRTALSARFIVAVPEWDVVRWAYDKRLTHRLAADLGVAQPLTWLAADGSVEDAQVGYPAILKPAFARERNAFTTAKAWPVADRAELLRAYREASELVPSEEILVQELIPGQGASQLSFAALADDGRAIASLTACRARQYPMDFGRESTFVYTVEAPDVEEAALRLIAAVRYSGLIEIEFKRDPRDGRPKLLDINPRVWGWHSLGARAGVDFVHLQWRLLHGDPPPLSRARLGVAWARASTDVPTCARELIGGRLSPAAWMRSFRRPVERAMFAGDDPLPGFLDVPLLAAGVLGRRLGKS